MMQRRVSINHRVAHPRTVDLDHRFQDVTFLVYHFFPYLGDVSIYAPYLHTQFVLVIP
jgi:hypothetical protein